MGLFNKDKEFDYVVGVDNNGNPITRKIQIGTGKGQCASSPGSCKEHQTKEQWKRTRQYNISSVEATNSIDDVDSISLSSYSKLEQSTIIVSNEDAWKVPNYGCLINKNGRYGEVTVREVDGKYQVKVREETFNVDSVINSESLAHGVIEAEITETKGSLSEWDKAERKVVVSGWREMTEEQLDVYSQFLDVLNSK